MKKWLIVVFSVVGSVLLSWAISEYIENRYYSSMPSLIVARRETVSIRMRTDAVAVWQYKRIFSPVSGQVHFLKRYDRVRKAERIAYVQTSLGKKVYVNALCAGFFMPVYDFWSERLPSEFNFRRLTKELGEVWDNRVAEKIVYLKDGIWVKKGDDMGEILPGYGFYLYVSLPRYLFIPAWKKRRYLYVTFLEPYRYISRGFVDYISLSEERMNVILWFFMFDERTNFSRHWIPVEVVITKRKGVVLPASAVIIKNGIRGIMIAKRGKAMFYPVEGEWISSKKFLATNVRDKTLVVSNPVSVKEGMWIGY